MGIAWLYVRNDHTLGTKQANYGHCLARVASVLTQYSTLWTLLLYVGKAQLNVGTLDISGTIWSKYGIWALYDSILAKCVNLWTLHK